MTPLPIITSGSDDAEMVAMLGAVIAAGKMIPASATMDDGAFCPLIFVSEPCATKDGAERAASTLIAMLKDLKGGRA